MGKAKRKEESRWVYDEAAAERVIRFIETLLFLEEGVPFILEEWQKDDIIRPLFGWIDKETGLRKHRRGYVEIPSGNGKTKLSAALALYMLTADGEHGAEVYCAATTKEQALKPLFADIREFILTSPVLLDRIGDEHVQKMNVFDPNTFSTIAAISSNPKSAHGKRPHCLIIDELHAFQGKDAEFFAALDKKFAKRDQPLALFITTAGNRRHGLGWEWHEHALKCIEAKQRGEDIDESLHAVVYAASKDDDWTSEETWRKANPGFGTIVRAEEFRAWVTRADSMPRQKLEFLQLNLNIWTQSETKAIPFELWDGNFTDDIDEEALVGRSCFAAHDQASTSDVAAFVMVFPPVKEGDRYIVVPRFWIPLATIHKRSVEEGLPYEEWRKAGLVIATPGNRIDVFAIAEHISDLATKYDIKELAVDAFNSTEIIGLLEASGLNAFAQGQTFVKYNDACLEFEKMLQNKSINHGNNPVLRNMAENLVWDVDREGRIKPSKENSTSKIDGMASLVMAIDREMRQRHQPEQKKAEFDSEVFTFF